MIEFILNGKLVQTDDEPDTPLLWVIRDTFKLTGSKFGCGIAQCGACTMHIDGGAQQTCILPIAAVAGKTVTTIEGLGTPDRLHPLQQAWVEQGVPQCGYCQSGMIMAVSSLLAQNPNPSDADIDSSITNVCRCGTYPRVRRAIRSLATA